MSPQTTSPDANIELLRAGFDDLNAGDLDACVARAAPDLVMNLAELPEPDAWSGDLGVKTRR